MKTLNTSDIRFYLTPCARSAAHRHCRHVPISNPKDSLRALWDV